MKVKEFIKELKKQPQNNIIYVGLRDGYVFRNIDLKNNENVTVICENINYNLGD